MKNIIFSPQFSAFDDYWDDANSLQCGSGWGGWGDVERTCFSGVFMNGIAIVRESEDMLD